MGSTTASTPDRTGREGVARHRSDAGGDHVEAAAGIERDDGDGGEDQQQERRAGTAGAPRWRHETADSPAVSGPTR